MNSFFTGMFNQREQASTVIQQFAEQLVAGTMMLFETIIDKQGAVSLTSSARQHPQIMAALTFATKANLMINNASAARISYGIRRLPDLMTADTSVLHWWMKGNRAQHFSAEFEGTAVNGYRRRFLRGMFCANHAK